MPVYAEGFPPFFYVRRKGSIVLPSDCSRKYFSFSRKEKYFSVYFFDTRFDFLLNKVNTFCSLYKHKLGALSNNKK